MENVEKLVQASMAEIERVLSTKSVVGEPITVDGNTIVPLVSIGFGFGAGSAMGRGQKEGREQGGGGGTGGGGGAKPVAIVIINKEGVHVAPIVGGAATALERGMERVTEVIAKAIEKRGEKKKEE
jgi:uncharacterized spore protein YtfJ